MKVVITAEMFKKAYEGQYAIGAFNVKYGNYTGDC
ncbi:MAG: hypothetical protein H6Q69_699 [Firmicutes bacterium]|nr:hypothetical protein [Bacillota bacterium]